MRKIKEGNCKIEYRIIEEVMRDSKLQLNTEDELLEVINELYKRDTKCSSLYEYVDFINDSGEGMKEFVKKFDFNDLNIGTWSSIATRL